MKLHPNYISQNLAWASSDLERVKMLKQTFLLQPNFYSFFGLKSFISAQKEKISVETLFEKKVAVRGTKCSKNILQQS